MARNQRVKDDELETDQLKDMLDDGVSDNEPEQSDDEGTGDDQDGSDANEQEGSDKEAQDGEQRDSQRGRDNEDDRSQRGRDDKRQQNAGRNQGDRNSQQQAQINSALLQKLDDKTRNAVIGEAINFVRQRTQPVFNKLEMDNRKLTQQLQVHARASEDAKQYGLQPHERSFSYRMYAAFKKDPVATVKHLITELKKSGKNVDFGGEGAGAIDLQAIRGMIDEATRPMRGDFERREQEESARIEAQEQLTDFLGANPQAQPHIAVINGILQRYPNETLETAWLKVQLHATKNGLDLSVPFNQQRGQQQQNGNHRPMNLRGNRNVANGSNGQDGEITYANPNARWGDIIANEMRAAGYKI